MGVRKNVQRGRAGRHPGQSAREQQQALASESPITTLITRILGVATEEQAWGKGAAGEEHVGKLLNQLGQRGWTVIHDLKISPNGANVDHLVIGPPGVFVIDTKHVSGNVWVGGPNIQVDGYSRDFVSKLEAQAMRVREKLLDATGGDTLWVQGVLVFVKPNLNVKQQPRNVVVLSDDTLIADLRGRPEKLDAFAMKELAQAASRSTTWR
jgi:hypothetical protein